MPVVIKYCPRCLKGASTSILSGVVISALAYALWDYLGNFTWGIFLFFVYLKYQRIL